MNGPRRAGARAWEALNAIMVICMALMIVLVFINVVLRYGFHSGLLASSELSRFLFVWVVMLSAIICLRDGAHLDLRLIESLLPARIVRILRRIVYAVIFGTSCMLLTGSFRRTLTNWSDAAPLSGLPTGLFYLAGVVAGTGLAAIAAYRFIFPDREPQPDGEIFE